jgi:hypothetical protein
MDSGFAWNDIIMSYLCDNTYQQSAGESLMHVLLAHGLDLDSLLMVLTPIEN